jgi:hypothetical protein
VSVDQLRSIPAHDPMSARNSGGKPTRTAAALVAARSGSGAAADLSTTASTSSTSGPGVTMAVGDELSVELECRCPPKGIALTADLEKSVSALTVSGPTPSQVDAGETGPGQAQPTRHPPGPRRASTSRPRRPRHPHPAGTRSHPRLPRRSATPRRAHHPHQPSV